jgi:hypothetical protein
MAVSGPVAISSLRVSAEPRPLLQRPEASRQSPAGPRSQWRLIGHKTCEADARPRPLSHGRANGESCLGMCLAACLGPTSRFPAIATWRYHNWWRLCAHLLFLFA